MIQIQNYSEEFESEYLKAVIHKIPTSCQKLILKSCKKYLPSNFFDESSDEFKTLVLAPLQKLKDAYSFINENSLEIMNKESFTQSNKKNPPMKKLYKKLHDSYSIIANSEVNKVSVRVRLVRNSGLNVCPYCNRDYINCRADNVAGAQLDHFFNKGKFPLFSICLYNLIPVCGNCNRIKGAQKLEFSSPFDSSINWINDITFTYDGTTSDDMKIIVKTESGTEHNIAGMRIREAYQIHSNEVLELLEKKQMYNNTQNEEIQKVLGKINLSDAEIKKIIFGPEITEDQFKNKPLTKMMYDLHKELKIYP
ncbi:hypothetical protein [Paenibacillus xylanexedens]|uniref:hypothetical protein n=1 Tax=Paenibacillus xylanexedens TaxID=528191 RepID=UPI00119EE8B8|nr:hypothetical protein [Paenibacillus xylanexedens]